MDGVTETRFTRSSIKRPKKAGEDNSSGASTVRSLSRDCGNMKDFEEKRREDWLDSAAKAAQVKYPESDEEDDISKMRKITEELHMHLVLKCNIQGELLLKALNIAGGYQDIVVRGMMRGGGNGVRNNIRSRSRSFKKPVVPTKPVVVVTPGKHKPAPRNQTFAVYENKLYMRISWN